MLRTDETFFIIIILIAEKIKMIIMTLLFLLFRWDETWTTSRSIVRATDNKIENRAWAE
jgi:hypothetical protein